MIKPALAAVVSLTLVTATEVPRAERGDGVPAERVRGTGASGLENDLDQFMKEVLARRDDNWKKLQQYVFDEREVLDVRGPGHVQMWGDRREYTWYIRDGFFVRSPVKANGVTIGDADRRKAEKEFLEREQRRERRRANRDNAGAAPATAEEPRDDADQTAGEDLDVNGILRQTREPEFVSSAYFLRFRFDEGKYALAGRETLDGREVLKIEYYPSNLFRGTDRRREREREHEREQQGKKKEEKCIGLCGDQYNEAYDKEFRRLMNKTSLVTLWVEPTAHQIVKYTFENVDFDWAPGRWLARLDGMHASMTMGQPFPGVWLPATMEFQVLLSAAVGQFDVDYHLNYHDYRQPDVKSKITIPKGR